MSDLDLDDVVVIVPAYNEETKIFETLEGLRKYFKNIIVVDDGSLDNTYSEAKKLSSFTVKHPINLGQGAAIQTGIFKALMIPEFNYLLTFDADGQHSPESAAEIAMEIKRTDFDIILGSRFLGKSTSSMPLKKRITLKLGVLFTRIDSKLDITDTHNGLRVMKKSFAKILNLKQPGMAHASEILNCIHKSEASWKEFPVKVYYTDYSKKKGQSILNAINILTEVLHK